MVVKTAYIYLLTASFYWVAGLRFREMCFRIYSVNISEDGQVGHVSRSLRLHVDQKDDAWSMHLVSPALSNLKDE